MPEPGIYFSMSHAEYHAVDGYVSNSYLSRLNICPAAAKVKQDDTTDMSFGRSLHAFILDGETAFSQGVAIRPDVNLRTKDGKAQIEAFLQANTGKDIISADDYEAIKSMAAAVNTHPLAGHMINEGNNEVSIFWTDPFSGINCKARPDKVTSSQSVIIDLKKTRDASERGFTRSILQYGYHRQAAFYLDGMKKVTGNNYDIFALIAVEDKAPFRVEVYTLSPEFIEYGRQEYRRLISIECQCRNENNWPNYNNKGVTEIELPHYLAWKGEL